MSRADTMTGSRGAAIAAMGLGLALTVVAAVVPFAAQDRLADHIRAGYPAYSEHRIDSAVTTYLVLLSVVGALGVATWLWSIWVVRTGKRWAPAAATALLVIGVSVWLTELLTKDTSGDTGLPVALSSLGAAPCLAGLVAVVLLWRRS